MYVLDSDHLSLLQRPNGREHPIVSAHLLACGGPVSTCVVSFHEQTMGCNDYISQARTPAEMIRGYELLQQVIETYVQFPVLPFDAGAVAEYLRLKPFRLRIGAKDLRIASIVLSRNLTLATRNHRDFAQVPGLRLVDWTK